MIRRAAKCDLNAINSLLNQVLNVHADIRPDIFIAGTKKYTDAELTELFTDDTKPVFVYEDENGSVLGHAFCVIQEIKGANNLHDSKELYIDDICVDEKNRGRHIATALYEYVLNYAKIENCNTITLNVWEGNDAARSFYESMGMFPRKTMMELKI